MDLEEALRCYLSSPISELEFLKEIEKNAIFFDSSMRERLSQLKAGQQKQEMPANLSIIHALRATQEGFEDDGVMRNYDLLESQFKENLTKEDRELLKSPKPNSEKLQELKIRLLEKNAPKRKYEIPKPNEEVVSLANDLLEILSSQSPNDKRIRVLLEYLSVLERTPWDLESLLRDYNFVFSSTIGQHNMRKKLKERAQKLKELDGKERFITLNMQYRMHPLLGQLVSDVFYKPHNESFESPLEKKYFKHNLRILDNKPLAWIDVKDPEEKRNADGSYYRESEITEIKKYLDLFMEDEPDFTFGVITFFSEQKRLLEQALKGYANLEIGTVDSFQGKEFDVVFLSSVRTRHTEGFGFLKDSPHLCVALSHQKRALIVAGDREKFDTPEAKDKVSGLFEFLQLCKKEGKIL
ncbi:ATP-binding protein [Helicobacter pylori]